MQWGYNNKIREGSYGQGKRGKVMRAAAGDGGEEGSKEKRIQRGGWKKAKRVCDRGCCKRLLILGGRFSREEEKRAQIQRGNEDEMKLYKNIWVQNDCRTDKGKNALD